MHFCKLKDRTRLSEIGKNDINAHLWGGSAGDCAFDL